MPVEAYVEVLQSASLARLVTGLFTGSRHGPI